MTNTIKMGEMVAHLRDLAEESNFYYELIEELDSLDKKEFLGLADYWEEKGFKTLKEFETFMEED